MIRHGFTDQEQKITFFRLLGVISQKIAVVVGLSQRASFAGVGLKVEFAVGMKQTIFSFALLDLRVRW